MTIYFIEIEKIGSIKIGYTASSPERRMAQLQTGQPGKLLLIGTIPGDKEIETNLHKELNEYRLNGEWFSHKIRFIADHLIKNQGPWYLCREPAILDKRLEREWAVSFDRNVDREDDVQYSERDVSKTLISLRGFYRAAEKFKKKNGVYPKDPRHKIYKIIDSLDPVSFGAANYINSYSLG